MSSSKIWYGLCGAVVLLGLPNSIKAQNSTFSVVLNAGYLSQSATTTMNSATSPGGALLLLVAAGGSNGTTFTNTPSAGQYVSGGDVVLGASSFNAIDGTKSNGIGKISNNSFTSLTLPTTVSSSAYIELRWYPNITLSQYMAGTTPAAGSIFGAYNPLVTNSSGNATLNPDQPTGQTSSPWQLPSGGSTINLYMLTTDSGISGAHQVPSEGYANFTVPGAGVPEPSAGILGGLALVVMVGARRVSQRLKTA